MATSSADVICGQETVVVGQDATVSAQNAAKSLGWKAALEPDNITAAGGRSAGVVVAARAHLGMALPTHHTDPLSAALSQRNILLLQGAARVICSLQGPWIVAGDWSISPTQLLASGWPQLVRGVVRTTGQPTCLMSEYDYFVVSNGLNHSVVAVAQVHDAGISPHTPVRRWLRGRIRRCRVRVLATPPKAEACMPAGCLPAQAGQEWDDIAPGRQEPVDVDRHYGLWVTAVEKQLADIMMLDDVGSRRFQCRADGTEFKLRCPLGAPSASGGRVSPVTLAWRCLATWLTGVAAGASAGASLSTKARAKRNICARPGGRALAMVSMPELSGVGLAPSLLLTFSAGTNSTGCVPLPVPLRTKWLPRQAGCQSCLGQVDPRGARRFPRQATSHDSGAHWVDSQLACHHPGTAG